MTQVILYSSWACPFSKTVEIALKLKGVSFTLIQENLFNPSSEVRKKSPLCPSAPLLVHNGEVISHASVIVEYIDETWKGKSIFPKNPKDRAKARSLIKFIGKCMPAVMRACWGREWGDVQKMAIENARNCLRTLENELNGKQYFGGDSIGAVDISAVFIALWVQVNAEANAIKLLTTDLFPLLSKWAARILSNTIIKETLPPRDVLLSYHQKLHPQDFGPSGARRRTELIDQYEPKLDENFHQKVEGMEVDSGECYGILRKICDWRKNRNFVFPADFSK
ncbi:hypothetical protein Pfo_015533 [Paulownia fortunei]|nr:hypothetical protein Pfo_015533 [Paulownia fortunei]